MALVLCSVELLVSWGEGKGLSGSLFGRGKELPDLGKMLKMETGSSCHFLFNTIKKPVPSSAEAPRG